MKFDRLVLSLLVLVSSAGHCQEKLPATAESQPQSLTAAEQKFASLLTNAQLTGYFTTWDEPEAPQKDTYTLEKIAKLNGDLWMFVARIQYGEHDTRVLLPLPVRWAGDTPVIMLDKFPVPGFGIFSARIVIHDDQYAGTWNGGDHGGHMYGRIVKLDNQAKD